MAIDVVSLMSGASGTEVHVQAQRAETVAPPPASADTRPAADVPQVSIETVISELQSIGAGYNRRLSFSINEKLGEVVVKIIDTATEEVIREIPPAELQRVHERIREVVGVLFNVEA